MERSGILTVQAVCVFLWGNRVLKFMAAAKHSYDYKPKWTPLSPITIANIIELKIAVSG